MKNSAILIRIIVFIALYLALSYYGGEWGRKVLYPIRILVTFLHELGHAIAALLTGGTVDRIQINVDGSGWTRTMNGNRALSIMGGYIGSAFFGNIIFFIGAKLKSLVKPTMILLASSMLFTAVYWFNSVSTSIILLLFAISIIVIAYKTKWSRDIIMFLGLISVIYIIQDFNVGPSSDLKAYATELPIFSEIIWKYVWLSIVILIFAINLRLLMAFEGKKSSY